MTLNENYPQLLRQKGAESLTYEAHTASEAGHYFGSDPNIKYGWGSHTNRPVPVYYQGEGAKVLDSFVGQGYEAYGKNVPGIEGLVDQVHIYQTMYSALTEGAAPVPQPPVPQAEEETEEPALPFELATAGILTLVDGTNGIIFGTSEDDVFDASTSGGNNRIFGRDGDDVLIGGSNDRLAGDKGDDALFAGNCGNVLTGGEGRDQFWIAYASLPNSGNSIADFVAGTDVIGIAGLAGVSEFEDLSILQSGADTRIVVSNQAIAVLQSVPASTINSNSFVFA